MPDLLFLCHRIPYPPNKGDKIRSWHMLKHLAARYAVHLGCFIDDPEDRRWIDELKRVCADVHCAEIEPKAQRLRSLGALWKGRALTLDYFHDAGLARWVDAIVAAKRPTHAFAFSSPMAAYVPNGASPLQRRVVDMVDVDSDKWRQYAERKPWPLSLIYGREARRLLDFEREIARRFDASLFVSPQEAALFRQLAPESAERIGHVNNGVDHAYFSPERDYPNPFPNDRKAVVFTGAMDYWPNVDAVQWFAREVLPALTARGLNIGFWIVGSKPTPDVRKLEQPGLVTVTGRVEDIRPYVAHAAVIVAPLRIARGVQNKVLEGMAMAKPVVATPEALEGIEAQAGQEVAVANEPRGFAMAVTAALSGRGAAAMGVRARARVVADYGWAPNLARLDAALEG
jgi:sugar transferase (PEP-CTERM/EpsH1 system associated)